MTNPFERGATATQAPTPAPAPTQAPSNGASAGLGDVGSVQSNDPYSVAEPTAASGVRMSDEGILDQLLLVEPTEYIPSMMTSASREPTDVVRANILPLTGPLTNELQEDVLIFQEALKRELKKTYQSPNRWLLAFHTKGTAKPGQSAPYIFQIPTDEQRAVFEAFKASRGAA